MLDPPPMIEFLELTYSNVQDLSFVNIHLSTVFLVTVLFLDKKLEIGTITTASKDTALELSLDLIIKKVFTVG